MKRLIFVIVSTALMSSLNARIATCASADDILHCHGVAVHELYDPDTYLMNTTEVSGTTAMQRQNVTFTSPALLSDFVYGTITITVCHTQIIQADVQLYVVIGWYDEAGTYHMLNGQYSDYLEANSTVSSYSVLDNVPLLAGQRLCVRVSLPIDYYVLWGDLGHDSRISYDGMVNYVPELPPYLIPPLFIIATLAAVIVLRKKMSARPVKVPEPVDIRMS